MAHLIEKQLQALISDIHYPISLLSNVSAFLNEVLEDVSWVGFYLYKDDQLILGPFQGFVACLEIPLNKGVCGRAASTKETQLVLDVHQFPGHIACDSRTNSEIVLPICIHNKLYGVLDIDSLSTARFNKQDQQLLEACVHIIEIRLTQIA